MECLVAMRGPMCRPATVGVRSLAMANGGVPDLANRNGRRARHGRRNPPAKVSRPASKACHRSQTVSRQPASARAVAGVGHASRRLLSELIYLGREV